MALPNVMFKRLLQLMLFLLPSLVSAQTPLTPTEAASVEATMSDWLAHPLEFGVKPKRAKYFATVRAKLIGKESFTDVHIVEYEMPDGAYGRGLVNPVTWSFLGPIPYDALGNEGLVIAYTGWLWLFPALDDGRAQTTFQPTTLAALLRQLKREGISEVVVTDQYKVSTSEFFEFHGIRNGVKVKGAGAPGSTLVFDATAPQASLPVVFTYLGKVIRAEI